MAYPIKTIYYVDYKGRAIVFSSYRHAEEIANKYGKQVQSLTYQKYSVDLEPVPPVQNLTRKAFLVLTQTQFNTLNSNDGIFQTAGTISGEEVDFQDNNYFTALPPLAFANKRQSNDGTMALYEIDLNYRKETATGDITFNGANYIQDLKQAGEIEDAYYKSVTEEEAAAGRKTIYEYLEENPDDWEAEEPV